MLEVHLAGRQMGKTTNALLWMAMHPDSVMLCHSSYAAEYTYRMARHLDLSIGESRFIGPHNGVEKLHGTSVRTEVVVDNLDLSLPGLFGLPRPITRVTMTGYQPTLYHFERMDR